jgi:hypothetical protein
MAKRGPRKKGQPQEKGKKKEPLSAWQRFPSEIDGVEVFPDHNGPGSNIYDLSLPHLTLHNGVWKRHYWRQVRGLLPFHKMEQPTEEDLRGWFKVYEEEFGIRPTAILLALHSAGWGNGDHLEEQWAVAMVGPHDSHGYEWPVCEWCGAAKGHKNPCPRPSVDVLEGVPLWNLPVTLEERDDLIALLNQQETPWAKELQRRLEVPRPRAAHTRISVRTQTGPDPWARG